MKVKAEVTLDRLLSRYGVASRTVAREMIKAGRVRVNGSVQRDPEHWVNRASDTVLLDGRRLRPERKIYLLFYKPKGVIVSHGDPDGRKTIYDYLGQYLGEDAQPPASARAFGSRPPATRHSTMKRATTKRATTKRDDPAKTGVSRGPWISPVGRLDKDTSGLLILTNDTEFANFVTDPQSSVAKTYLVKVSGLVDDATVARLAGGVTMNRGDEAHPVSVRRLEDRGKYTWLEVVLTEGKNREVRRMIEAIGFSVLKLVRTAIGPLTLAGLEVGGSRPLSGTEVSSLKQGSRARARGLATNESPVPADSYQE